MGKVMAKWWDRRWRLVIVAILLPLLLVPIINVFLFPEKPLTESLLYGAVSSLFTLLMHNTVNLVYLVDQFSHFFPTAMSFFYLPLLEFATDGHRLTRTIIRATRPNDYSHALKGRKPSFSLEAFLLTQGPELDPSLSRILSNGRQLLLADRVVRLKSLRLSA